MFGLFKKKAPAQAALPALRADQLQPRLKHINFLRALQAAGVPPEQQPSHAPLCGELIVTYAFDLPDSFMMATPKLVESVAVSATELPGIARANLERALPQPKFFAKDGCKVAVTGDDLEATLLLVDGLWDAMASQVRGDILVSAPRRDRILMCDSADPNAVATLREQAQQFFDEHNDAHRLSTQVMVRRGGAWALFDGQ